MGSTPHLHEPVDGGSFASKLHFILRFERQRDDTQIDIGRQPPVQPDLFFTISRSASGVLKSRCL
jgi:hypothetical protein